MQLLGLYLFLSIFIIFTTNTKTSSMSKNNTTNNQPPPNHALSSLSTTMLSNQTAPPVLLSPSKKNTNPNSLNPKEISKINSFLKMVRNGDQDLVLYCLENGMNPNVRANNDIHYGMTPLMIAVGDRRISITKILLKAGANPNTSTQHKQIKGITALMIASMKGPLEIIDLLINAGADINLQTSGAIFGSSALTAAIGANKIDITKRLIERGADINIKTSGNTIKEITPLMIAAQNENSSILKILLDINDTNINAKDSENKTALIYAYISGNINNVKLLLEYGATNNLNSIEIQKILENYLTK